MITAFTKVKDFIAKYWFAISSLALAVLYFLYDRQNKKLGELYQEAQINKMGQKLEGLLVNAQKSEEDHKRSFDAYLALKRRHMDVLQKLGLNATDRRKPD